MLRVSKLLMKAKEAPKAYQNGQTGMEPSPQVDPTSVPGGKASGGPKAPPVTPHRAPSSGTPSKTCPGAVTYGSKSGGSMEMSSKTPDGNGPSEPTPVVTNRSWEWETTVWSDSDEALDRILRA